MSASKFSKATVCFVCFSLIFAVALIAAFSCGIIEMPVVSSEISAEAATATSTAPLEDGQVLSGYSASGTKTTDISTIRSNPGGTYYLTGNMTVNSISTDTTNTCNFYGTLDGNGKTITIDASQSGGLTAGGLFSTLSGTVKNVNIVVTKFSFSTGNAGRRNVGIIAGELSGGTVENVKITFNYSPSGSDPTQGFGTIGAYFYDTGRHSGKTLYTFFGGVAGSSTGGNIKNTTVNNATSGDYGVCIVVANGGSGGPCSYNSVAGFVGCATGGTLNFTNIRVQSEATSVYSSWFYEADSTKENYSGVVLGWSWSEATIKFDGVIYDYSVNFDYLKKGAGNQSINKNHFGSMFGRIEATKTVKDIYAPASMNWIDGERNSVGGGIILTGGNTLAFDKSNSENTANIIIKTTYNAPNSSNLNAYVSIAGQSRYILDAVMCSESNGMADGAAAYVSVAKSGVAPGSNTQSISFIKANTSGTVSIENSTEKTYDGTNVSANRSLTLSNGTTFPSAYTAQTVDKVAGTYIYKFTGVGTSYNTVRYNRLTYLYDGNGNVFKPNNNVDIEKDQSFRIRPLTATVSLTGGTIVYGQSAEEVAASNTPTINSLVNKDRIDSYTVSGYAPCAQNAGETVNVGYTFVIKDSSGRDISASYNITGTVAMTVTKRTVSGSMAFAKSSVYDGRAKEATFIFDENKGLLNTDQVSISYTDGQNRTDVTAEGFTATATLPKFDDTNSNYIFADGSDHISAVLLITPKTVTISVNSEASTSYKYSGVWGDTELTGLFVSPNDIHGETLLLAFKITHNDAPATVQYVGEYIITATLLESYLAEDGVTTVYQTNYAAEAVETKISISPILIKVTSSDGSKTYDGLSVTDEELKALFTVENTIDEGSYAELIVEHEYDEIKDKGEYYVTVSLPDDYDKIYALDGELPSTTYTISPKEIEVNWGEISFEYDGKEKKPAPTADTGIEGESVTIEVAVQEGSAVNIGTYNATAAQSEPADENYVLTNTSLQFNVIAKDISGAEITLGASLTYNGTEQTQEIISVTADGLTVTYNVTGNTGTNAKGYTLTVTGAGNFSGTATRDWEIAKALLTVTADDKSVNYGDEAPEYTYVITGYRNDEDESVLTSLPVAVSDYSSVTPVSESGMAITVSGGEADNYYFVYVSGAVTISKAASVIDVSGVPTEYTYTGKEQTVTGATLNHKETKLEYSSNTFTTVAEGNGMSVTITAEESANYLGASETVIVTVSEALLYDVTKSVSAEYDGAAHGISVTLEGFVNGEDLAYAGGVIYYGSEQGEYKSEPVTFTDVTGDRRRRDRILQGRVR